LIRHGLHRKRRVQQFFYCCVSIRCQGNYLPSRCLATIGDTQTERLMRGIYEVRSWDGLSIAYIRSFIKTGSGIRKLTRRTHSMMIA
jgi:hypothetical protein